MVFFTCSHCGVSLKKNQVEKHVNTQCRNCQMLSCMDCGKDFWGDDYKAHIKCITEEEKYSGKDFKPRPGANKGERKQEEWIQKLQEIARTADTAPEMKKLLNQLVTFNNVPRKKAKFQKFLQNSVRVPFKFIDEAWDLFSKANETLSQDSSPSKENSHLSDKTNQMEQEQAAEEINKETENATSKKKKDKKKKREEAMEVENVDTNNASVELANEADSSKKKKHKHKKHSLKEDNSETANVPEQETELLNGTEESSRKKKKKKKSKEAKVEESVENEDTNAGENQSLQDVNGIDNNVSKSKKKKSKNSEVDPPADEVSSPKKKKRKHESKEEETTEALPDEEENSANAKKKKKGEHKENLDTSQEVTDTINHGKKLKVEKLISVILQQTPEKEMSLKKLKKKVIAEFNSSPLKKDGMDETSVLAKIEKKILSKQNKYQLINDRVKLI